MDTAQRDGDSNAAPSLTKPVDDTAVTEEVSSAASAASAAADPATEIKTAELSRRPSDDLSPIGAVRKKQKMYMPLHPMTVAPRIDKKVGEEVKLNFAQRLMELLEMEDVKPHFHWCEDGKRICIEDPTRFAEEMLPKYFSDTKYKSFMVRIKRWGFNVVTPKSQSKGTQIILECANFRRDQPELCLLMGDKRRNERSSGKKNNPKKQTNADGIPTVVTTDAKDTTAAGNKPVSGSGEGMAPSELAMARLHYQQRLQDLQTMNLLGRYGAPPSRSSLLGGGYGRFGPSSLYGLGEAGLQREGSLASVGLYSIEREIQDCLHTIAAQQEKLATLQGMKELKMRALRSSDIGLGGSGLGSLLAKSGS